MTQSVFSFNKLAARVSSKAVIAGLGLVAVASFTGCSTPGYSGKERAQMIGRNWDMEGKMLVDDIDDALLLRPMTTLSHWNIR